MKRIIVIGSGGSGKSTFSRRLGEAIDVEVIHLDKLYWLPNWVEPSKAEWAATVRDLIERGSWIIDGNYGGTLAMRLDAADTVIFLDLPRATCIFRVLKRNWQYRGKSRPEMADGCVERLDLKFLLWVWNFRKQKRPRLLAQLAESPEKNVVILCSNREVEEFLEHRL